MKLSTILRFSWRYFKAKKSTNAINIISWISVTAIIVGSASLIIILSAFNGFESLVKSLYGSYYADLKVSPVKGKVLVLTPSQLSTISAIDGVSFISPSIEEKALIQHDVLQAVVSIKGIDSNYQRVSGVAEKMYRGNFNIGNVDHPGLVFGAGVEQALGLMSDRSLLPVSVYFPKKAVGVTTNPADALGTAIAYPTGSFAIQSEFDNKFVFTDLGFLKVNMNYKANEFSYAEIAVNDDQNADNIKEIVSEMLGNQYRVENRYEQNRTLYNTIQLEKFAIYAIFSLILIVAAFNMIGSLSMLVLEKQKDIQILMAMGADSSMIRKIFLSEGLLLAMIGNAVGIVLALLLYWLQVNYKLVPLQGATFLIDYYPVKLVLVDFLLVSGTVFIIGIIASWFPASKASKQPIELHN
jgi:lipoprotein-releasing system permease protein